MRVAFCFFGQSRSFQFCYQLNRKYFEQLRDRGFDLDFYIHTWTSNCGGDGQDRYTYLDREQLVQTLVEKYNAVTIEVDDLDKTLSRYPGIYNTGFKLRTAGFLYSHSRVLQQVVEKCRQEKELKYDYIITLRFDEWFLGGFDLNSMTQPIKGLALRTINGSTVPENRWDLQDIRDVAVVRDEGFCMNFETTTILCKLFQWVYSECSIPLLLSSPYLRNQLEVPETLFSTFFEKMEITQESRPYVIDRVIVREPCDKLLNPEELEHLKILCEVREWVDWYTKDIELFEEFVKMRLKGIALKEVLGRLSSKSGIDFLENWGKNRRFDVKL